MPEHEYFDQPVIILRVGEGMINLSAPPERLQHPLAQERMARVALHENTRKIVRVATHAIVIGCGGTGWYTAMTLAMADLCAQIILYDGDTIEEVNLNRLPVPHGAIGYPKAEVLAAEIVRVRPGQAVMAFNDWFPDTGIRSHILSLLCESAPSVIRSTTLQGKYESRVNRNYVELPRVNPEVDTVYRDNLCLLFDCTDNPVFQNQLAGTVGARLETLDGGRLIHTRISYDGVKHITIKHGTVARILDEQAGRYTNMPSWALPAQLAATLGVYSAIRMIGGYNNCPDVLPVASIHDAYGSVLIPTPQEVYDGEEVE